MEIIKPTDIFTLEDILEIDDLARNAAYKLIDSKKDTHKLT